MITYKTIHDRIKQWCATDPNTKNGSFDSGEFPDNLDTLKDTKFPLIFIVPRSVQINNGENIFPFDFIVMSQTKEATAENVADIRDAVTQIQSDTLQIINDFVMVVQHPDFMPDEIPLEITLPIQAEPFEERFKSVLTGWNANIEIKVASDYCP